MKYVYAAVTFACLMILFSEIVTAGAAAPVPSGVLQAATSGFCLTAGAADKAQVTAQPCDPGDGVQQWQVTPGGTQLRTAGGLCLTTRPGHRLFAGVCGKPGTAWLLTGGTIRPSGQPQRCVQVLRGHSPAARPAFAVFLGRGRR